jgi:hypothetical protein
MRKPAAICINCSNVTARRRYTYCSNKCQTDYQYQQYILGWQRGEILGLQRLGVVSNHIKRYLREKYNNQCCVCGWAQVNQFTKIVPLVADHIDGNWRNNSEDNLRLLCANCDALTETYAALNKGRGREGRPPSKRAQEAKGIIMGTSPVMEHGVLDVDGVK